MESGLGGRWTARHATASDSSDVQLMTRLRAADPTALDHLLERYWGGVAAYVARLSGDRAVGEDLAQEVFLRLWQRRIEWEPVGSLRAFLYAVARNLTLNHEKRRRREIRHLPDYRTELERRRPPNPSESTEQSEIRAAVDRAVAQLPPRRREVFVLAWGHHLSYRDIGEVMGISTQTVANQLSAAVAELRGALRYLIEEHGFGAGAR